MPYREYLEKFFGEYVWRYKMHRLIQADIEGLITGTLGKRNIFYTTPPRHGKTSLVTIPLPAYWLRHNPKHEVIVAMHSQRIANKISRKTRRIVRQDQGVSEEAANVMEWETAAGGRYRSIGVGGFVAGTGGHLLLADDLVPNRKQAESQLSRDSLHDWWQDDFITRRNPTPGGKRAPIVMIMCMTGDTPVMMANGEEKPLSLIKVGDSVATFSEGRLTTAIVKNHCSNRHDTVYKIMTTTGRVVRANARHPFLIEDHGELKWVRLKHLTTACRIVTVKDNGESGKERRVPYQDAESLQGVVECAINTTSERCVQTGINQHRTIRKRSGAEGLRTDTASLLKTMKGFSQNKTDCVPSVANLPVRTCVHTGEASYVSIIATKPTKSEACCATTVTLPLDTPKQKQQQSLLPDTCDFTSELIVSIELDGVEEVFDVQIEGTENFIANGVVSHNTRWHVDDIAGRVVNPDEWLIRRLPAICDYDPSDPDACTPCPLGRQYGEALSPMWPLKDLLQIKANMSEYSWLALYQGRPTSKSGLFFDTTMLTEVEHIKPDSSVVAWVRYFDFASSPDPDAAYTATVLMALHKDGSMTIAHVDRIREGPGKRNRWQRQLAEADAKNYGEGKVQQVEEKQPGAAGRDRGRAFAMLMRGHSFAVDKIEGQGSKTTRADPYAATMAAGMIDIVKTHNGKPNPIALFKDEHRAFPLGKLKDWVDAGSGAHNWLTRKRSSEVVSMAVKSRRERLVDRQRRR